jgi:hypothetical protein
MRAGQAWEVKGSRSGGLATSSPACGGSTPQGGWGTRSLARSWVFGRLRRDPLRHFVTPPPQGGGGVRSALTPLERRLLVGMCGASLQKSIRLICALPHAQHHEPVHLLRDDYRHRPEPCGDGEHA